MSVVSLVVVSILFGGYNVEILQQAWDMGVECAGGC